MKAIANAAENFEITIEQIEAMTESDARSYAGEVIPLCNHTLYLVDLKGRFGYSCLVFKNSSVRGEDGFHLYRANIYELYYSYKKIDRNTLRDMYIVKEQSNLFTKEQLFEPIRSYEDYKRRAYYIVNYYAADVPYVSIFGTTKAEQDGKFFDPVDYTFRDSIAFVNHHIAMFERLERLRDEHIHDVSYWKGAFMYEMWNHEYIYNWDGDYDVLSVFGDIEYNENNTLEYCFRKLGFNSDQIEAYHQAKREYLAKANG